MQELQLTLTIDETNQILDALGQQPFKSVFTLIGKIQQQAADQLNGQQQSIPDVRPRPTTMNIAPNEPQP